MRSGTISDKGTDMSDRPTAIIEKWMTVQVGAHLHLIGVMVSGHERLPPGAWAITSPIGAFDPVAGTATTRSSGRRYALRDRWRGPPAPGAVDVVARAIGAWRLPDDTVVIWNPVSAAQDEEPT
jgi:hypothetical protein